MAKKAKKEKKVPVYAMGEHEPYTYISPTGLDIKISLVSPRGDTPPILLPTIQDFSYQEQEEGYKVKGVLETILFTKSVDLPLGMDLKFTAFEKEGTAIEMTIHNITSVFRGGQAGINDILVTETLFFTANTLTPWHEVK